MHTSGLLGGNWIVFSVDVVPSVCLPVSLCLCASFLLAMLTFLVSCSVKYFVETLQQ